MDASSHNNHNNYDSHGSDISNRNGGEKNEIVVSELKILFCLDIHDNLTLLYTQSAKIEYLKPTKKAQKIHEKTLEMLRQESVEAEAREVTRHLYDLLAQVRIQRRSTVTHPVAVGEAEISFADSRARVLVIFSHFDGAGCGVVDVDMLVDGLARLGEWDEIVPLCE